MYAPQLQGLRTFHTRETAMSETSDDRRSRTRLLRVAGAVALAGMIATAVGGCNNSSIDDAHHPRLTDPARRHPIVVVAETATLDVSVPWPGKGGEARAYVETTRFMRNYRHEGRGPLNIAVPRNAGRGTSRQVQAIRLAAHRAGVPSQRLRVTSKPGDGLITLSYDRIAAIGPTCGDWSEDATRRAHVLPYNNFGCATQRNMAAMAANPTDLMFPAQETPRGSETRATDQKNFNTGLGKMIQGAGTSR